MTGGAGVATLGDVGVSLILLAAVTAVFAVVGWQLWQRVERLERELEALRASPGREARAPRPAAAAAEPSSEVTLAPLFERVVGGRLLIWTGGIALAAAGIFLIRHSIELVTPAARMIGAALLGLLLIGTGEYARAGRFLSDDRRIAQSLVGAGIAVLYATAYGSHLLFGLIGSGTAAALMVLITAAALVLALRHGAPTAAIGLVGGFLTPLLVGDPSAGALPVLAYLALLDIALFAVAWRRDWGWLAAAAVAGSFAWTGYFVLEAPSDALAAGMFAGVLGIAASLLRPERGRVLLFVQPLVIALIEAAILVGRSDIGAPAWLLFGALAAASLVLAACRSEHRYAPLPALALTLLLIAVTTILAEDPLAPLAAVVATLLFAGGSAPLARRGQARPALIACAALAGPLLILRLLRPGLLEPSGWGLLACGLALAALGLLALLRSKARRRGIGAFAASLTAVLLLAVGLYDLLPRDLVSAAWLVGAVAMLVAGVRLPDDALRLGGLALLTATTIKVFGVDAAALEGVLRILSFLGLGVALIGIGMLYGRVLGGRAGPPADHPSGTVPRTVPGE